MQPLPGAGFDRCRPAEGAFYLYAEIGARTNDSAAFCARMLAEAGVAAAAGVDFDADRGHRTVRFSYCGPESGHGGGSRTAARLPVIRKPACRRVDPPHLQR